MQSFTIRRGEEPTYTLPWQYESAQNAWTDRDFSSGYTFSWNLKHVHGTWAFTASGARSDKTTGVTGYDGGVVLAFATGDSDDLDDGTYTLYLRARETATSKDRDHSPDNPVQIVVVA